MNKRGEVLFIVLLTLAAASWVYIGLGIRNEARKSNVSSGTNTVERSKQ